MKIKVISPDLKVPILLRFPLSFLHSSFLCSIIRKGLDRNQKEYMDSLLPSIKECTAILDDYIRENGHFVLADIREKDGTFIQIRI